METLSSLMPAFSPSAGSNSPGDDGATKSIGSIKSATRKVPSAVSAFTPSPRLDGLGRTVLDEVKRSAESQSNMRQTKNISRSCCRCSQFPLCAWSDRILSCNNAAGGRRTSIHCGACSASFPVLVSFRPMLGPQHRRNECLFSKCV